MVSWLTAFTGNLWCLDLLAGCLSGGGGACGREAGLSQTLVMLEETRGRELNLRPSRCEASKTNLIKVQNQESPVQFLLFHNEWKTHFAGFLTDIVTQQRLLHNKADKWLRGRQEETAISVFLPNKSCLEQKRSSITFLLNIKSYVVRCEAGSVSPFNKERMQGPRSSGEQTLDLGKVKLQERPCLRSICHGLLKKGFKNRCDQLFGAGDTFLYHTRCLWAKLELLCVRVRNRSSLIESEKLSWFNLS